MPNPQTEWAAFAQPEELYRLMVEEAKDYAIFMLGPDRRFATWNDGAKRILGYEAAEILGQPSDIIFTSEDRARGEAQRELQTAEDEGRAVDERWHLRRDGTRFWGSGIVTALRDDAGRLQGFCKVMRDQTERKRLEEERDRLFKLSIDMLCVAGVDGFFKRVNSAFETTLGFTAEELTSRPIVEFQHPDDRAAMWRELEKLSRGEPTYNLENRFLCKDGGYKWTAWTYAPFTEEGLLYGVGRDFTRRKQAEEERAELLDRAEAARAEAEAANRTKDEFLATLSHELRTPLTAILGWTRILSAGKLSDSPGQAARALEIVERNARVQVQIVDDILDVSRIVAGKFRLEPRPALLQPIVEAAADTIRPAAEAKGIQLQAVFAPDAILISGDPERLQQAVWNLLANAVKFTPPGGSVEIRVERQGSDVDIVISDTGDGLSPDFLPYVFDRFRQADSSISRKHMGL
ncbi:MAG: PAS domain S-box protein, partial [Pyrinomonadaceae bacterium]